jgi:hypothetical protein
MIAPISPQMKNKIHMGIPILMTKDRTLRFFAPLIHQLYWWIRARSIK